MQIEPEEPRAAFDGDPSRAPFLDAYARRLARTRTGALLNCVGASLQGGCENSYEQGIFSCCGKSEGDLSGYSISDGDAANSGRPWRSVVRSTKRRPLATRSSTAGLPSSSMVAVDGFGAHGVDAAPPSRPLAARRRVRPGQLGHFCASWANLALSPRSPLGRAPTDYSRSRPPRAEVQKPWHETARRRRVHNKQIAQQWRGRCKIRLRWPALWRPRRKTASPSRRPRTVVGLRATRARRSYAWDLLQLRRADISHH